MASSAKHWISITLFLQGNSMMATPVQKRPRWTDDEDRVLDGVLDWVLFECKSRNWHPSWKNIAKLTGLNRTGKSCWERKRRCENRQDPNVKKEKFSQGEDESIIRCQLLYKNGSITSWKSVAAHLPGRTATDVKNRWYNCLKKKKQLGKSTGDQRHTTQPIHLNHNIDPNAASQEIASTRFTSDLPPLGGEFMPTEEVISFFGSRYA